jgi:DNA replication protein
MKKFSGFPARMDFTPLPNLFFSGLLPEIDDLAELKTTLYIMAMLYSKKGYPRFVTMSELLGNTSLVNSLKMGESPEATLIDALNKSVARGTFIKIAVDRDGTPEELYLLNTAVERQTAVKIQNGELKLGGLKPKETAYVESAGTPDIFTLYEENIGLLTPMIADELREAERLYPEDWIRDAIKEAVNQNKRKWYYISAILERWSTEGKKDGTYQRHSEKTDPDKYIKGKYGHMVRR